MPPTRDSIQDLARLRADEASYVATISATQGKILQQLELEKVLMAEEVATLYKQSDLKQKALEVIRATKDITRDLAQEMAEYTGNIKEQVPYAAEIAGLQRQMYDLQQGTSGLLPNQVMAMTKIVRLNLETLQAAQQQRIQLDMMKKVHGSIEEILGLQAGTVQSIGSKVMGLILNPWTAVVALLGLAVAKFVMMQQAGEDFRKTTGLTLVQSQGIEEIARNTTRAQRSIGVSYEDALKSAEALYKMTGNTALVNQRNVDLISEFAARLGVSVDDSAKFVGTLALIGKSADDIKSIGSNMEALALGYGVSVKDLMSDIANATGDAYSYLQKYPNEFAKTAAKARALGLDMTSVSDITKNLLNLDESIGDEMEANILTGKNLNLDAARYYALIGDTGKAMDSVLSQLGSVAEYQRMAPLAQESFAKVLGVSTEKLGEMLRLREKEAHMTSDQRKLEKAAADETNRIAGVLTQTKQSVEAIVSDLASVFLPVLEVIKPIIGFVASMFRSVHEVLSTWPGWLKETVRYLGAVLVLTVAIAHADVAGRIGGMLGKFKTPFGIGRGAKGVGGGLLDQFGNKMGGAATTTTTTGGGGMFKGLGEFIKGIDPVKMLAGAASMVIIAGAVWILSKAMENFAKPDMWKGVGLGIIAMGALVGAVALLGTIMTTGVGAVAILAGAAAILVIAGAMWVLGDAMEKISNSSKGMDDLLNTLMMVDPVKLLAIGGSLAAVGAGLSAMAVGGAAAGIVNAIFGSAAGGKPGAKDKMDMVLDKLDMVAQTIKDKNFDVYLDGRKVSKEVAYQATKGR